MTAMEFKAAREKLGLSINQLASILNTNPVTVRRWEMPESKKTGRPPNPIACQVLRWMRDGVLNVDEVCRATA